MLLRDTILLTEVFADDENVWSIFMLCRERAFQGIEFTFKADALVKCFTEKEGERKDRERENS